MSTRVLAGALVLCGLSAAMAAGQTPSTKPVRFYIPDSSSTWGSPTVYPFKNATEIRYLIVLARDRMPRRGGALTALYWAATEAGRIQVDEVIITVGHASRLTPDPEFTRNLMNAKVVYWGPLDVTIPGRRFIRFPLSTPFVYRGDKLLAVDIRLRGIRSGVRLLAASHSVLAIYAKGAGAFGARRARYGPLAGLKTGAEFTTSSPTVTCLNDPNIGSTLNLSFNASANIGNAFAAGCAFTSEPGIDIGEYTVPLSPDPLFWSVWLLPQTFVGFQGTVGAGGFASGSVVIPEEPSLIGVSFAVAFVTFDRLGVSNVSMEQWVTIGMGCGG